MFAGHIIGTLEPPILLMFVAMRLAGRPKMMPATVLSGISLALTMTR
jgi:hypothetical protein